MRKMIRNELSGWKTWEVCWLSAACVIIAGLSVYWGDTLMGIISATTGVACVVCTGKGKLSAYLFGLVNCALYAIISFQAALYGETMLNTVYYIPMQFYGFYVWSRNMNAETQEVRKRHMTGRLRVLSLIGLAAGTFLYGLVLQRLGDALPFIDSFTTVSSVEAMIISIKMYAEQWWLWVAVDIFSVIMWLITYLNGNDSIATLLMWVVYLGNAVIMCTKWELEVRSDEKKGCVNL